MLHIDQYSTFYRCTRRVHQNMCFSCMYICIYMYTESLSEDIWLFGACLVLKEPCLVHHSTSDFPCSALPSSSEPVEQLKALKRLKTHLLELAPECWLVYLERLVISSLHSKTSCLAL